MKDEFLNPYLANQEVRAIKKIEKAFERMKTDIVGVLHKYSQKGFEDEIMQALDGGMLFLVDLLQPLLFKVMTKGQDQLRYLTGYRYSDLDAFTQQYFASWRNLHLSNRQGSITKTTIDRIIEIIKLGVQDGLSYNQIAKQITQQGDAGVFSRSRAQMIAVNEIGKAFEFGQYSNVFYAHQQTGTRYQKKWLTTGDARVTPECSHNAASGRIDFFVSFPSDDMTAPRSSNPRCRCTTLYRSEDSADIDEQP